MSKAELFLVQDVRELSLPRHSRTDGDLVVLERENLPFSTARVFTVSAVAGAMRGQHAHKRCSQLLMCVHGRIAVQCDDGSRKLDFLLDSGNKGVFIPPSIWGAETYLTDGAVLMVLCDRGYEEEDYLRDYQGFLEWRKKTQKSS